MINKKFLVIVLFSAIFLLFGVDIVKGAGLCEPCAITADCDPGLECIRNKCRGCPAAPPGQIRICNPLQACEFEDIVTSLINFIFKIAIVLAPLMIVIGGALFVTSGGNLQQIERAKKIILWTVVGFLILLLAKGIMALIESILGIE